MIYDNSAIKSLWANHKPKIDRVFFWVTYVDGGCIVELGFFGRRIMYISEKGTEDDGTWIEGSPNSSSFHYSLIWLYFV